MTTSNKPTVLIHFDETGGASIYAYGNPVRVICIDERMPHDRVYELSGRSDPQHLIDMIGEDKIGYLGDGGMPEDKKRAIEARIARGNDGRPKLTVA